MDEASETRALVARAIAGRFRFRVLGSVELALEAAARGGVSAVILAVRSGACMREVWLRLRDEAPETVRLAVAHGAALEGVMRDAAEGRITRYLVAPWTDADLVELVRWAVEVHAAGRRDSAVQLRLLETEKLRTLGQVSASVLHDLSQPVMTVSMCADQLRELAKLTPLIQRLAGGAEASPSTAAERAAAMTWGAEVEDIATSLSASAKVIADLVRELRPLQKADNTAAAPERVDPLSALRTALAMCKAGHGTTPAPVGYEGPELLPEVDAVSTELVQVFVNLIRNAQQALEEHAVPDGRVVARAKMVDTSVEFQVIDNGPGIAADVLTKLGTAFFTTRERGTGLGLHQCQRLVSKMGGRLHIESAPGQGTRVSFALRATDPNGTRPGREAGRTDGDPRERLVLGPVAAVTSSSGRYLGSDTAPYHVESPARRWR